MADDVQSIRSLNWRELFPFTNLFRAFGIAKHPSKLALGFALLVLVYAGGRVLDAVWPAKSYAVHDELEAYTAHKWSHDQTRSFSDEMDKVRTENAGHYRDFLVRLAENKPPFINLDTKDKTVDRALEAARKGEFHSELQRAIVRKRNERLAQADQNYKEALLAIDAKKDVPADKREEMKRAAKDALDATHREQQAEMIANLDHLEEITPRPLFDAFFNYESVQFHKIVSSALAWNWFSGITVGAGDQAAAAAHPELSGEGVLRCTANLTVIGPGWLITYHPVFFILFAVWFLIIWAIFGGAIARIAAVHVARDEKISVRQALRFSSSKLLSFVFAPVIPLIIILGAGLIIALGGLLLYIPVIGPIIVSVLYILALVAGFVITLVGTGTVGGLNLMYATIAVEGSDSFDAISRSFSYVFARPWRMIFYTVVSLVYGALCFLFVRLFVYVMLALTHFFTQWFLVSGSQPNRYWPEIFPSVNDQDLAYRINFQALSWSDGLAAFLIAMWVYVVLTLLAAFVISFYFSSNTLIYYLMRREVDATELDDVYVEETEEDFAEVAAAMPAVTPTPVVDPGIAPPAAGTT